MIHEQLLMDVFQTNVRAAPPPAPIFVSSGLTPETITLIRTSGLTPAECATLYGCSRITAWRIQTGRHHAAPRAAARWRRVSDHTVEEIRVRREESGWTVHQLVEFYHLPRTTILSFCQYRRR